MNKIDLKNKVAIVTGGAQGFGLAIVEKFLASDAKVIIWDKDKEMMSALNLGDNVHTLEVDVTNFDSVSKATEQSLQISNSIDILVNNAGIAGPSYKTWEYPIEEWQKVIDIDLSGVFYCCKSVVPHMIEKNYEKLLTSPLLLAKKEILMQCLTVQQRLE